MHILQVLENFILSDKLLVETTQVLTTYISFFTVCSYRHSPQSASHSNSNGPCYLNTHEIHICTNPRCVPPGENRGYRSDNQEGRKLHRFRSAENCVVSDYHVRGENRGHHSLSRNWSTDKIPPTIPPKQLKHNMYIHASKCAVAQNGGPHGKYPPPQDVQHNTCRAMLTYWGGGQSKLKSLRCPYNVKPVYISSRKGQCQFLRL